MLFKKASEFLCGDNYNILETAEAIVPAEGGTEK